MSHTLLSLIDLYHQRSKLYDTQVWQVITVHYKTMSWISLENTKRVLGVSVCQSQL